MPKGKKGVTLTELIVAVALLGIIMAPVSMLFYSGLKNFSQENETMIAQKTAREIMYSIIDDLRKNDSTSITVTSGSELSITPTIRYTYMGNALYKNGSKITDSAKNIVFIKKDATNVFEKNGNLITVNIAIKAGNGREISLQESYRIRSNG